MEFSLTVFSTIFSQLYSFMLDTKFFGVSLMAYWIGSVLIFVSVSLLLVFIQTKHGG